MKGYKVDTNRKNIKKKIEQIEQVKADIKKYKTVSLLDLTKLPDSLFQALRKKMRQDGTRVYVLKMAVLSRVLATEPKLKDYSEQCNKPMALILSNKSPLELNKFFKEYRKKRAAKVGDVAQAEIMVPEGETDLPPGPALSELKAGGLNVQIKAGKIAVVKDSVVAKAGEALTVPKVKALQTLNIMPFEIMANYIMGFDGSFCYTRAVLDSADNVPSDLAEAISQGVNFSINTGYPTELSINILLGEAVRQSINLSLNGNVYSSSSMEQLLVSAMRQGTALDSLGNK
jgi:large subunit ribosomal protein L10